MEENALWMFRGQRSEQTDEVEATVTQTIAGLSQGLQNRVSGTTPMSRS